MPDPYRESPDSSTETPVISASAVSAEQEILELEKKLAAKRASLGREKDVSTEALAKVEKPLEQIIGQEKSVASLSTLQSSTAPVALASPIQAKEKAGELKRYEKTQQLKGLIDIAFQQGISYAVDVVKEMDNPFLMDELHDVLVDELRKELVERGKLEEI
jgi:hypothetical protein